MPGIFKNSVLNSLQVSSEMKQAIWLLATETTGPLVQRVTKNIMVVKCKANQKQLLGFLEIINYKRKRNDEPKVGEKHVIASAFLDIEEYEDIEIVYAAEIYIPVMKRLVEESRRKIKELTTWN